MFANMGTTNQSCNNISVELMDPRSQQQAQPQQQEQGAVLPGFRFHPTDEELVAYYLRGKVMHRPPSVEVITQLDIYKFDPWDLPKMSMMKGEKEWYFFCPRDRKYRNSARPNRVTGAGFWKATGTDRPIYSGNANKCIGLKKSLVFYTGRAAKSTKTDWMMHEFRMPASSEASNLGKVHCDEIALQQDAWAVCRIFKKTPLSQRHAPASQPWGILQPQHIQVDISTPSLVMPGECSTEHDSSSQDRSDTTSEEFEVEGGLMQRTTQDPLPNYLPPRGYAAAASHVQQPQQQLKQEQSTATWPVTMANGMEDLLQDTSSARSNILRQSSHVPNEMYPLELPNTLFGHQDVPSSMRGALEFVSCIINPPQSGPQFVGSNFDNNPRSRESMNLSHHQGQPTDNICPSPGLKMNTQLIDRFQLVQQIPQGQLAQPFFTTHQPWN